MIPGRCTARTALGLLAAAVCILTTGGCGLRSLQTHDSKPNVPTTPPDNTMAAFSFRHRGGKDSKFYAVAFSRALSDRLHGSPEHQINQSDVGALEESLREFGSSSRGVITDETAVKAGKRLGVRYVITGDFQLKDDKAEVSANVLDVTAKSPRPVIVKGSGTLNDLPRLQTALAEGVIKAMDEDPRNVLVGSCSKPNFSKPATLLTYGRGFFDDDTERIVEYRWKAVKEDPQSLFAVLRALGSYVYGDAPCKVIQSDKRLQALITDADKRFADNPHIGFLVGWLYIQQYQYRKAESRLTDLVEQAPDFARGHDALAHAATYRGDADQALKEARKFVELWPTSSRAHIVLAQAYESVANHARRGHYYNDMTVRVKLKWRTNMERAYREASIAVTQNPKASTAWGIIMSCSLELGYRGYDRRAFEEMVKINPKDYDAYSEYQRSLASQWGGTEAQRQELYGLVDKAFGKDSPESCMMRGWGMLMEPEHDSLRPEILRMAEKAIEKSKGKNLSALNLKCRVLIGLRRRDEMLKVAEQGFALDPSPNWRMLVIRGYCFRWEDKHDPTALSSAHGLLRNYVSEYPNDVDGHNNLGWCLSHMGRRAEAKKEFLRTLELDPTNETAREKMAYVQ